MKRRDFIKKTALGIGAFATAPYVISQEKNNDKPLRLAFIGAGSQGHYNLIKFITELKQTLVAVADVNTHVRGNNVLQAFPDTPFYSDYRVMLKEMHDKIDAVIITIPDHSHYAAAMCALNYGLSIYLEKPMCHTIWQIRNLYETAKKKNVVTQMGNQSHSCDGIRHCKAWIDAGIIGTVREVVLWTDRPLGTGVADFPNNVSAYPPAQSVPENLDWDLWQNVAEPQAYFGNGIVNEKWRGWWKYGSGSLGDIGCHMLDIPLFALDLKYPEKIVAKARGATPLTCGSQEKVDYYFSNSNQNVPVKITWHSGFKYPDNNGNWESGYDKSLLPALPEEFLKIPRTHRNLSDNGSFFIGDKGVLYSPSMHLAGTPALIPGKIWEGIKNNLPPIKDAVREGNHYLNFIDAVRGNAKASSDFEYAHALAEVVQLGNLAIRSNKEIVWDAKNLVCVDNPEATKLVNTPMRQEFLNF